MSTICADQHKLYHSHQLFSSSSSKKPFKDLDIPPRKLLLGKKTLQESPDIMSPCYKSNLQKFLPFNDATNGDHDHGKVSNEDLDPYSSDHFRMYEFKVRRCNRSRSHDWTDCPFAHPGEKARRRDPGSTTTPVQSVLSLDAELAAEVTPVISLMVCLSAGFTLLAIELKLAKMARIASERFASSLTLLTNFEFFLRFHAMLINTIRVWSYLVLLLTMGIAAACHSMISSPTSTLLGMSHLSPPLSPSLSPPLSPGKQQSINGFSPISRYSDRLSKLRSGLMSYKDVFTELMTSLEAMNVNNEAAASGSSSISFSAASNRSTNTPWMDSSFNGEDHHHQQLILSPSTPNPRGSRNFFSGDCSSKGFNIDEKINNNDDKNGGADPDLGWVNELLM
ncbi:hypothetical protein GH714_043602 [Hevea brasiliensis]|uniref:AtC3H23-like CCCH zinc finger domain-containing protein n=1 Tax=Hevea brasiliensis TaxID=3981 RepID=A0A6A6K359_HEVBR|nr:hypothetical protein GH714_043602 [Hevea brasiliensis]